MFVNGEASETDAIFSSDILSPVSAQDWYKRCPGFFDAIQNAVERALQKNDLLHERDLARIGKLASA